jgi:hypothetical protein
MSTDFNEYFGHYTSLVKQTPALEALKENLSEFMELLESITEEQGVYRYQENKWTVKEVIAHVLDAERVFAYRAMRFARNDKTDLPGYDENEYANNSDANERSILDLKTEFDILRQSSIQLYRSFNQTSLSRKGTANQMSIDVNSIFYLIAGHCRHHYNILKERYGV